VDSQEAGGLIMARRGGRRGGQGNRGRRSKTNRSRSRSTKSSTRSKSTSSRRGGQGNRGKGFGRAKGTVSRKSVGKGLRSVAKAAGKVASKTKGFAGVRSIASSARAAANKVKQARADRSSKQARSQRRYDRLAKQHGLDYSRMNPSFKANVNVSQAYKALGLDKNRLTRAVYNKLPKRIKDFSWKHQFNAPTKLGIRDGYRAPNRGGQNIASATKDQLRSIRSETPGGIGRSLKGDQNFSIHNPYGGWLDFYNRQYKGQSPKEEAAARNAAQQDEFSRRQIEYDKEARQLRPIRDKPERDWLGDFYRTYNIGGEGGKLDDAARDYWSNEAKTKGRTATLDIIRGTARDQGTWGGMSAKDEERIAKIPKGSRTNWKGRVIDRRFAGKPPSRRGKPPRQRLLAGRPIGPWLSGSGGKPNRRGRGGISSIAATMAARGF
tara:strand:+ start:24 stop:1334 length:1311 start_codon:yes stop_codon:yes gene_type:complete